MKNTYLIIAGLVLATAGVSRADPAMDQKMDQPTTMTKDQTAPSDQPAKPMKMSKKKKTMYKCPMDGTMSEMPGKCPKCGMEMQMVKLTPGVKHSPAEITAAARSWRCPTDGTVSDKPGKCPKCGMDMVEVKDEAKPAEMK